MAKTKIKREFEYLNTLRRSGATNMFGASPYLMNEFGLSMVEARKVLMEWMDWIDEDPANRDL